MDSMDDRWALSSIVFIVNRVDIAVGLSYLNPSLQAVASSQGQCSVRHHSAKTAGMTGINRRPVTEGSHYGSIALWFIGNLLVVV